MSALERHVLGAIEGDLVEGRRYSVSFADDVEVDMTEAEICALPDAALIEVESINGQVVHYPGCTCPWKCGVRS